MNIHASSYQAEPSNLNSSLRTFLKANHRYLARTCTIVRNPTITTTGELTAPDNRYAPTQLRVWKDFTTLRDQRLEILSIALGFAFPTAGHLNFLGGYVQRELDSEKATIIHDKVALWQPVEKIIDLTLQEAHRSPSFRQRLGLAVPGDQAQGPSSFSQTLRFQDHRNIDEEATIRPSRNDQQTPRLLGPCNICAVLRCSQPITLKPSSKVLVVAEYKPPHRLLRNHVLNSFGPDTLGSDPPMIVLQEVWQTVREAGHSGDTIRADDSLPADPDLSASSSSMATSTSISPRTHSTGHDRGQRS